MKHNDLVNVYGAHRLSQEEMQALANNLSAKYQELTNLKNRKAELVSQLGAEIKSAEAELARMSGIHQSGQEWKQIECRVEFDYDTQKVFFYSVETDELMDQRKMSQAEYEGHKQTNLFVDEGDKDED